MCIEYSVEPTHVKLQYDDVQYSARLFFRFSEEKNNYFHQEHFYTCFILSCTHANIHQMCEHVCNNNNNNSEINCITNQSVEILQRIDLNQGVCLILIG